MKMYIDQSGKIEDTARDTILGFSNGTKKAIRIRARTKRQLQELFRHVGQPRSYVIRTFTAGIALLLKNNLQNTNEIVIDIEYPGYEKVITKLLQTMLKQPKKSTLPEIHFALIGKHSRAHATVYAVHKKKEKTDEIVSKNQLETIIFTDIKNE